MVWVNTETHVYHKEGSRFYGKTKKGKYMSEQDAMKEGAAVVPAFDDRPRWTAMMKAAIAATQNGNAARAPGCSRRSARSTVIRRTSASS